MQIYKIANNSNDFTDIDEKESWFEKRTQNHIKLVKKYCQKIYDYDSNRFSDIINLAEKHDQSKLEDPEKQPYIYTTWKYKCKDDGKDFVLPKDIEDDMVKATEHHIKNNHHHPEYHSEETENLINKSDRDKAPSKTIDATKMPDNSIAEMVADWCAVSEERKTSPFDWANSNINKRWKFSKDQEELIYELLENIWV